MRSNSLLVTGAAGFLGSKITRELAQDHAVTAIDHRLPSAVLRAAAPNVRWVQADIADAEALRRAFAEHVREHGAPGWVIHLAAFWHFGGDRPPEYERTNIQGTRLVLEAAERAGADGEKPRVLFASSMGALEPPPPGVVITERSREWADIPYGGSKAEGERIVEAFAARVPAVILRIGGIFTEWCELPPLWSLMRLWGGRGLQARVMPGQGRSGFAYLHRDDLARMVRRILERSERLSRCETLLGSSAGVTTHAEIFPMLRAEANDSASANSAARALHVPKMLAKLGVAAQCALGKITGRMPFERPWMLDYIDRPLVCDPSHTYRLLDWSPTPGLSLLERLPEMRARFTQRRTEWDARNERRNARVYAYAED
ncbi:MAG: NAD(P)-dependent oxidoreductase [Planctomycetes bacterium]|nr:NAD(P)-dependent oxidoreductase [Planctomycetota bacterium]